MGGTITSGHHIMTMALEAARRAATAAAVGLTALAASLAPSQANACACGCGVFDIGDGSMTASGGSGFSAWFRYSYMDQNRNWERGSKAPAGDNKDKEIETSFYTLGVQYAVDRRWTIMAELPIYDRGFTTTDDGTVAGPEGSPRNAHLTALGDLQLTATYTGLASDRSTGLTLGVKVPTGDDVGPNGPLGGAEFDRDTLPGTGSTDLIFGAYHLGKVTANGKLAWFARARYQVAVAERDGYRPGNEFNSALGLSYDLGAFGSLSRIAPMLQLINTYRNHDTGVNSDSPNSGYERLLISPGVEVRAGRYRISADVALPIYQHVNSATSQEMDDTAGQLVAPAFFKIQVGYAF